MEKLEQEKLMLYFEIHFGSVQRKTRELVNVCYINYSSFPENLKTQASEEIKYTGLYSNIIVATPTKLVIAYYLDEEEFLKYLESINYPYNNSLEIVDKYLKLLTSLMSNLDLQFLSGTLTAIVNEFMYSFPNKTTIEELNQMYYDSELKTNKFESINPEKYLMFDNVFPSLPAILKTKQHVNKT